MAVSEESLVLGCVLIWLPALMDGVKVKPESWEAFSALEVGVVLDNVIVSGLLSDSVAEVEFLHILMLLSMSGVNRTGSIDFSYLDTLLLRVSSQGVVLVETVSFSYGVGPQEEVVLVSLSVKSYAMAGSLKNIVNVPLWRTSEIVFTRHTLSIHVASESTLADHTARDSILYCRNGNRVASSTLNII